MVYVLKCSQPCHDTREVGNGYSGTKASQKNSDFYFFIKRNKLDLICKFDRTRTLQTQHIGACDAVACVSVRAWSA